MTARILEHFCPFIKIWGPLHSNFGKKCWEHFWSQEGYSRNYCIPNFNLQDSSFSFYKALSDGMLGSGATFLAFCQKWRPVRPQVWKNNFWEHLWSQKGYSRDYFKPNFRSLGPLVSILHGFEWLHARFWLGVYTVPGQKRFVFRAFLAIFQRFLG